MKSFRFRSITFIVATALAVQQTAAQVMCSCSPTVFDFVLNLDGSCGVNDIVDNSGIDGSFCFTEEVNTVPGRPDLSSSIEMIEEEDKWWLPIWKQYLEPVRERILQVRKRVLQSDPVTEIVSVLFLEFDTSGDLTVINQDDTYIDVSLGDGDPLTFNSVSSFLDTSLPLSEQMSNPALVPGGASMILYGKTASGAVFRNRFFWIYDMNCGRDNSPINVNDEIGWITVVRLSCCSRDMYLFIASNFRSPYTSCQYRMKLPVPGQHSALPYPQAHLPFPLERTSPH